MLSKRELLETLQENHQIKGLSQCYTCRHPIAAPLVPLLIQELRGQQAQGRMLSYSVRSLFLSVSQHCKAKGAPFERTADAFRNHVRNHVGELSAWFNDQSA